MVLTSNILTLDEIRSALNIRNNTLTFPRKNGKEVKRVYYQKLVRLLDILEGGEA